MTVYRVEDYVEWEGSFHLATFSTPELAQKYIDAHYAKWPTYHRQSLSIEEEEVISDEATLQARLQEL